MTSPTSLIRGKSLQALPSLVGSAYAAAVSSGHVIFSETELAIVRTRTGVPVSMLPTFIFCLLLFTFFMVFFIYFLYFWFWVSLIRLVREDGCLSYSFGLFVWNDIFTVPGLGF